MRLNSTKSNALDTLFVLILLALFGTTSLFIIFIGAKQYDTIADKMTKTYEIRTATSYLNEKINWNDCNHSISITNLNGTPAITLQDTKNGVLHTTYIYTYDGYLRELSISEDKTLSLHLGEKIVKLSSLEIESYNHHLYGFTLTDHYGTICPIYISRTTTAPITIP